MAADAIYLLDTALARNCALLNCHWSSETPATRWWRLCLKQFCQALNIWFIQFCEKYVDRSHCCGQSFNLSFWADWKVSVSLISVFIIDEGWPGDKLFGPDAATISWVLSPHPRRVTVSRVTQHMTQQPLSRDYSNGYPGSPCGPKPSPRLMLE